MASKAIPSETQRSKLERKERVILEAARTIFVDHGFDGARMQEIARRAGIGEGTIYSYYDSKAELMLAVLQQFWDGLTLEAEGVMASSQAADFFGQLQVLAQYHLNTVIVNADFINLTFALRRNNSEVSVSRGVVTEGVTSILWKSMATESALSKPLITERYCCEKASAAPWAPSM